MRQRYSRELLAVSLPCMLDVTRRQARRDHGFPPGAMAHSDSWSHDASHVVGQMIDDTIALGAQGVPKRVHCGVRR